MFTPHTILQPSTHHVTHLYHNADPVPLGACIGAASTCYYGGYALETRCHLGKSIIYDTVNGDGWKWAVDIRTHSIKVIIDTILSTNASVPTAKSEDDCVVCNPQGQHLPEVLIVQYRNVIHGNSETS